MRLKKYILTLFFIVVGFSKLFACPTATNVLVLNGDTVYIYMNSLPTELVRRDTVARRSRIEMHLFGDGGICFSSGSGDSYEIKWKIENNQLYLTGIYSWCYDSDSIKADLNELFEEVIKGKVKANWVSGKVRGGKELIFHHVGIIPVFEKEFEFEFFEGKLLSIDTLDDWKSIRSIYTRNNEKWNRFIYTSIDWESLPELQEPIRVILRISANEDGEIDQVEFRRSDDEILRQEAARVLKLMPWEAFFFRGEHVRRQRFIQIVFSEENRERFGR